MRVWVLGLGLGLRLRVWDLGFRRKGFGLSVQGGSAYLCSLLGFREHFMEQASTLCPNHNCTQLKAPRALGSGSQLIVRIRRTKTWAQGKLILYYANLTGLIRIINPNGVQ